MSEPAKPPPWEEKLRELRRQKLQPLLYDIEIARAVEESRPRDLYRLLLAKHKTAGLAERALIDDLLNSRRLFAEPLKRVPKMITADGVGTKLYGKQEEDPSDGTHIATLFFVLLFLPLYPLGQYLVAPAGGRRWYFLAKVPLNKKMLLWRRAALAGTFGVACVIAAAVFAAHSHTALQLVNGLDIPVTVQIDSAPAVRVPPVSHRVVPEVKRGRHHLAARTTSNELVEELDVDVPLARDVVAYNVLGAAPLYAEGIRYYASDARANNREHNAQEVYCGQRFIVRNNVRDIFSPPPEQIRIEGNQTVRWRFDVDRAGWPKTLDVLLSDQKTNEVAVLAEKIALLESDDERAVSYAVGYVRAIRGAEGALTLARRLTEHAPRSMAAHRTYQTLLASNGQGEQCRVLYRKLAGENPDSAMFAYLRARAELPADAVPLYADLVEKHPDDPFARRGYAWVLFQTRHFAEALPHFEKFAAMQPADVDALVREHAQDLVAVGRTADAIDLVGRLCQARRAQGALDPYLFFLYSRLARLDPAAAAKLPPEQLLRQWVRQDPITPGLRAWFVYQTDPGQLDGSLVQAITNANFRTAAELTMSAVHGPDAVLQQLPQVSDGVIDEMDGTLVVLLAAESQRRGDARLASRLLDHVSGHESGLTAMKTNVLSGIEMPDLAEADLELQAALEFAAARRAGVDATRAAELRERALQDDLLQGFVTIAVQNWKD